MPERHVDQGPLLAVSPAIVPLLSRYCPGEISLGQVHHKCTKRGTFMIIYIL
jgi:hypothetical protein